MSQVGSKKSRRGCVRCKQRRVKCDEQAPCGNCARRSEECSLLEPTPSGSSEASADPSLPGNSDEWIQDLELMYHYCTNTALEEMGTREKLIWLWRRHIPRQALKHDFLMHGLLAVSALHLAHVNPDTSTRYLQLCDKHQAKALKRFRTILSTEINPDLADALFALAATISVTSVARSCASVKSRAMDMDDVTEQFFLTRGVRDVIHLAYEKIKQGPMTEMFENAVPPPGTEINLPQSLSDQFNAIRQFLEEYELDSEALSHCQSALTELEDIYRIIQYFGAFTTIETGQIWRWQAKVTTGYVRLIGARCPPALIILAYYAAATTSLRTAWFSLDWGEYVIRGIGLALDPGMQYWIQWPMKQVHERMADLGVRVLESASTAPKPLVVP